MESSLVKYFINGSQVNNFLTVSGNFLSYLCRAKGIAGFSPQKRPRQPRDPILHRAILIGESPTNSILTRRRDSEHSSFKGAIVSSHSNSGDNHISNNEMYSSSKEEDGNEKDNNEEDFEGYGSHIY